MRRYQEKGRTEAEEKKMSPVDTKKFLERMAENLRVRTTTEVTVGGIKAKVYQYEKPDPKITKRFAELLENLSETTEFMFGRTPKKDLLRDKPLKWETDAIKNLQDIFAKLPQLPKWKEYGFVQETVFSVPLPEDPYDDRWSHMSPWVRNALKVAKEKE